MSNSDIERARFEAWVESKHGFKPTRYNSDSSEYAYTLMNSMWALWQSSKQSQWQPIETFPKDREILILSNLNNRYVGIWATNVETGNEAFIIGNDDHGNQMVVELENIKSWCELPQPPKE